MKAYAQYSTLGFQMLFLILAGYFAGSYLDKRFEKNDAVFALTGSVVAVVVSLIWVIRKLMNQK